MSYNIVILPDAQQDIEDAFAYYLQFSLSAIIHFNDELELVYQSPSKYPSC